MPPGLWALNAARSFAGVPSGQRPSKTWGVCRAVVREADWAARSESRKITGATTCRLCSPPKVLDGLAVFNGTLCSGLGHLFQPHADKGEPSTKAA